MSYPTKARRALDALQNLGGEATAGKVAKAAGNLTIREVAGIFTRHDDVEKVPGTGWPSMWRHRELGGVDA